MSSQRGSDGEASRRYAEGLAMHRGGCHEQAIRRLEPLRRHEGMLGRMADYYQAMARRALGIEALRDGRFDEAESHFRQAARTIGRSADLASYLAAVYAKQGRHERCIAELSRLADGQGDVSSCRKLAQARWRAGRREQARMTLTAGLRKLGDHAELHLQMGLFWAAEERFDEARKALGCAVQADCTSPDAHYYLGLAASAQRDVVEAVRAFQRAFELRQTDLVLAHHLAAAAAAAAAQRQGRNFVLRLPEAAATPEGSEVRQLAGYIASEPEFCEACLSLPESPMDLDLFEMLAGVVQMALAAHGDYADLHYYCSRIFDRLGRLDEAVEHARKALEINPRYVRAHLHMADVLARTERCGDSAEHIEIAISCGADWPDVHYLAGELLLRLDERLRARKHFQRALELNANYARAAEALAKPAA